MSDKNRLMRLHVADEFIREFLAGRITLDDADLPEDAQVVRVYYEHECLSLCLVIHSSMFNPVETGGMIPSLPPLRVRSK